MSRAIGVELLRTQAVDNPRDPRLVNLLAFGWDPDQQLTVWSPASAGAGASSECTQAAAPLSRRSRTAGMSRLADHPS
ncbi:hypothetical protein [Streptomyces acidiscabies]|uniref:Uncharacterized protein n=1 Tax=Streptomyces acidiscabies TaxID=42234 RepID=A0A0L0KHW2_9ACTN|nr:hypothetical protein [Streptomyces acidiscabies]KND37381.1 hypothetical protein IQ63_09715 [Streptomyces acidiscabies]